MQLGRFQLASLIVFSFRLVSDALENSCVRLFCSNRIHETNCGKHKTHSWLMIQLFFLVLTNTHTHTNTVSRYSSTKRCQNDKWASDRVTTKSASILSQRSHFRPRIFRWVSRQTGSKSMKTASGWLFQKVFFLSMLQPCSCWVAIKLHTDPWIHNAFVLHTSNKRC